MEEWRNIDGYDGQYLVSNLGRVKSLGNNKNRHEKILKPGIRRGGYLCVNLNQGGKVKVVSVHRLVAMAFQDICGTWFETAVCHAAENIRIILFRWRYVGFTHASAIGANALIIESASAV